MVHGNGNVMLLSRVAVVRSGGDYRLVLTAPVPANECLFELVGVSVTVPTRYSVQVGTAEHLDLPPGCLPEEVLDRYFWRFMNHSCDPSAAVRDRRVLSRRPLAAWSEVTFNYNTTEYDMAEPFECRCGSMACQGTVRGFRYLPDAQRRWLSPWLASHLRAVLDPIGAAGSPTVAS